MLTKPVTMTPPEVIDALFSPIGLTGFNDDIRERRAFRSPPDSAPAIGIWDLGRHSDALWAHRDRIAEFLYLNERGQGIDLPRSQQHQLLRFAADRFRQGATLIARRLGDLDPDLARFQRAVEAALDCRVTINAYLTPPGCEGFLEHFDTHDTLIIQVHGSKRWRLLDGGPELPLKRSARDLRADEIGHIDDEFDLRCGQVLYLPRGVVHAARSTEEISLHLTIGLHPVLWSDIAAEASALLAERQVDLRRRAVGDPPAALDGLFPPEILAEARDRLLAADVLERSKKSLIPLEEVITGGHRETAGERVRRDPLLPAVVTRNRDDVTIHFPGGLDVGMSAPLSCEAALRYVAASRDTFAPDDLPALSPESARLLIKRLREIGLVISA